MDKWDKLKEYLEGKLKHNEKMKELYTALFDNDTGGIQNFLLNEILIKMEELENEE
ncbi:MAG: hypothetical protein ACOCP8_01940 [archaeon]